MSTESADLEPALMLEEQLQEVSHDVLRIDSPQRRNSLRLSSRSKRISHQAPSPNISDILSGRFRQRRLSWSRSPDRLDSWIRFTSQQSELQQKRVRSDEVRRKTRTKRNTVNDTTKTLANLLRQKSLQANENPSPELLGLLDYLSGEISELEGMESRLEATEEELVAAEFALTRSLPKLEGSEADRTRDMLADNFLDFRQGSSSSGASIRSDPELNPEYQSKLATVNEVEEQVLDLQAQERNLRSVDPATLDGESLSFLQDFPLENTRLLEVLATAMSELEQLRDRLHPTQPLGEPLGNPTTASNEAFRAETSASPDENGSKIS